MAKIFLNFEGFQESIPIHQSKIKKASIQSSIFKKWHLEPNSYSITFEDLDDDPIDAITENDYAFAKEICKDKALIFKVTVKPEFRTLIKKILTHEKNQKDAKTDVEKAKSNQKVGPMETPELLQKKTKAPKTKKKNSQTEESNAEKSQKTMASQLKKQQQAGYQLIIEQKKGGIVKKMSIYQESAQVPTPSPPLQQKKAKYKYPCEICQGKLSIPYYFDPINQCYMCEGCEIKSNLKHPVVKIKDKKYAAETAFTYLCWAKHKDMSEKVEDESRLPKYYTELKEMFIKNIRDLFNDKIAYEKEYQKQQKKKEKQEEKKLKTGKNAVTNSKITFTIVRQDN